jgi:hypothetical protein
MNTPDYDKELKELKEEIRKVVGEKELERIMNLVDLSYQFDEESKFEITHEIIK